jgi:Tol biopolymer transport system component
MAFSFPSLISAQTNGLSIEDTVALRLVTSARMSPDGEQIAYQLVVPREIYKEDDGKPYRELHIVDLEGNSRPYVSGKIEVTNFAWSADGKSLYFVAKRNPDDKFNSLFEIPISGGEAIKRFTHVNSIGNIHPSPDGTRIAFTANDAPPDSCLRRICPRKQSLDAGHRKLGSSGAGFTGIGIQFHLVTRWQPVCRCTRPDSADR